MKKLAAILLAAGLVFVLATATQAATVPLVNGDFEGEDNTLDLANGVFTLSELGTGMWGAGQFDNVRERVGDDGHSGNVFYSSAQRKRAVIQFVEFAVKAGDSYTLSVDVAASTLETDHRFSLGVFTFNDPSELAVDSVEPGGSDPTLDTLFTATPDDSEYELYEGTVTTLAAEGGTASGHPFTGHPDGFGSAVIFETTITNSGTFMEDHDYIGVALISDKLNADDWITFIAFDNVTSGSGEPRPYAFGPDPKDGVMVEATWANLSWRPGGHAVSHDVYFGENFDDVNAGAEGTFLGNQATTKLIVGFPGFPYPDGLVPGTTYYWRIDEVNDTEPNSPWKGDVWSFSIPPNTAYNPNPADGAESVDPDVELSWTGGFGAKLHTVYFGEDFDDVNNDAGSSPQSETTYTPGPLKLAETYYWRVDEFDAIATYKGDVWSFTTQGTVGNPNPSNGAVDVEQTPVLTWTPGVYAASHQLYFGTDKEALKNANTSSPEYKDSGNLGYESYAPGKLSWHTTYYWRVDEVNNVNSDSPWTGNVWNFTTVDFIVIEDFEDYNDYPPDEIFSTWTDGYGTTTNGALIAHDNPPFVETTVVHGGGQSMAYRYNNNLKYSEATMTLTQRNWTEESVGELSLWFYGDASNAVERMYVSLNGIAVVYHDNSDAALIDEWTEWTIDLQEFAAQGVNLANVNTISIGFGDKNNLQAGGSGMVFFDDIRLYRPAQ